MPQQIVVTENGRTTIVPTGPVGPPGPAGASGLPGSGNTSTDEDNQAILGTDGYVKVVGLQPKATFPVCETIALSDEITTITSGTAKVTWRAPWPFTLVGVRASLNTASSSGIPTVDINEGGSSILSTKLTIDASEKTSVTAATAAVISDSAIADDAEITFDIDVAGTGAKGLKVTLYGTRAV